MASPTALATLRRLLRPVGRPVARVLSKLAEGRLQWIYLRHGIGGVAAELRTMRTGHADVLRAFGASVAQDAMVVGPVSIANARTDFSHLRIERGVHLGSEVFLDLAERVTIEEGATVSMRAIVITHFDAGRNALAEKRPRQTGPVTIARGAYVGAAAIILHGVTVGEGALVAAGAVVGKDVPCDGVATRDGRILPARPES